MSWREGLTRAPVPLREIAVASGRGSGSPRNRWKEPLALLAAWHRAAGAVAARRCPPLKLSGRTLVVRVPHAGWGREIDRHTGRLLEALAAAGMQVRELRWEIDPALQTAALGAVAKHRRSPRGGARAAAAPPIGAERAAGDPEGAGSARPPGLLGDRLEAISARYLGAADTASPPDRPGRS